MQTTTLTASRPADLIAYVPYRLGFRPRDSIVALSLRAPRGEVGLVVRVDLGDLEDDRGGPGLARVLAGHVRRDDPRDVVLVVYTDDEGAAARAAERLGDALATGDGAPVRVRDRWLVTSVGYRCLDCDDTACCPPEGRPLSDLDSSPVAADLVFSGCGVAESREEAFAFTPAPRGRLTSATRAGRRWEARRDVQGVRAWRRVSLREWRDVRRAVADADEAREPARVPAAVLGRVAAALADPILRDAVLLSVLPIEDPRLPDRLLEVASAGSAGGVVGLDDGPVALEGVGDALALLIDPQRGVAPDPDEVRVSCAAAELVAAHARGVGLAYALGLVALLAWWEGHGGLAAARAEHALAVGPDHGLARLVRDALACGMGPGWTRAGGGGVR